MPGTLMHGIAPRGAVKVHKSRSLIDSSFAADRWLSSRLAASPVSLLVTFVAIIDCLLFFVFCVGAEGLERDSVLEPPLFLHFNGVARIRYKLPRASAPKWIAGKLGDVVDVKVDDSDCLLGR